MDFEFDPDKSAFNLDKHGIDFNVAQLLWDDEDSLEVPLDHPKETRYLSIGHIDDKLWAAITTYRHGRTRIISVRRARKNEVKHYEEKYNSRRT